MILTLQIANWHLGRRRTADRHRRGKFWIAETISKNRRYGRQWWRGILAPTY